MNYIVYIQRGCPLVFVTHQRPPGPSTVKIHPPALQVTWLRGVSRLNLVDLCVSTFIWCDLHALSPPPAPVYAASIATLFDYPLASDEGPFFQRLHIVEFLTLIQLPSMLLLSSSCNFLVLKNTPTQNPHGGWISFFAFGSGTRLWRLVVEQLAVPVLLACTASA